MSKSLQNLLRSIVVLHRYIRDEVVKACEEMDTEELSGIVREEEGDTIYAIDRISEQLLLDYFTAEMGGQGPLILIMEGLREGAITIPQGALESDAVWRILIDPIDGTRGLMYQKRSAWVLTGVAPNRGVNTNLQDIQLAVQTEIPLVKQHLCDVIWARRGEGVTAYRHNRLTGENFSLQLRPSRARSIAHGFAMISRFFPGARDILAQIDEEIVLEALGPVQPGKAHCFEDQYICTGGQLYELMAGHDRFVADLRPLMEKVLNQRGITPGICCHPYDLCTELIARELGVIVTDESGRPLSAPLSIDAEVSWVAYANHHIRQQIEPLLQQALHRRKLLA